jgi:CheY-like chemotaxis protein
MADRASDQLNVLVIDDDEAMRRLLVDIVQRGGHQLVVCESAEDALRELPFWTFQVAFLDQRLPGMEGIILGEYLRRNNPDMTIALVTGEDDPKLEKRSRDLAITFVPKPFEVRDIVRVLDDFAAAARERDARRRASSDADFEPPIARYATDVSESYGIPGVPGRIEERVVKTLKRCLNDMRSAARYTERDRVLALSGLLAARVLNLELPRAATGRSLFEEYDAIMKDRGRRTEFEAA